MKKILSFFYIAIICIHYCNAQSETTNKPDSITAHSYYKKGENLFIKNEFDSAIVWFKKGEELFKKSSSWNMHFWSKIKITQCYIDLRQYDKAAEIGERIIPESIKKLGKNNSAEAGIYNVLGNLFVNGRSEFDKGIEYYLKSAKTQKLISEGKSSVPLASALNNLGLAYWKKGSYDKATGYFNETLTILKEIVGEKHAYVSFTYNNLALVLWEKGSFDESLEYYHKALVIFKQTLGEDNAQLAAVYSNMGLVYAEKESFDLALDYYQRAFEINKKNDNNEVGIAQNYNNIGFAYEKKLDFKKAIEYHQKALKIRQKVLPENHPQRADSYQNLGSIYFKAGNYNEALKQYEESLRIRQNTFGNKSPFTAHILNSIGILYHTSNNNSKALTYLQKAIYTNFLDFNDSSNIYKNPPLENYYNSNFLLQSLQQKAVILSQSRENKDVAFSIETFKLCDQLIDKIRNSHTKESDKVKLGSKADIIFKLAVETCFKLYEITNDKKYLNDAFYFSEKSRSNVLLSSINESKAKKYTGIPDSLLIKEQNIKSDISFYTQQVSSKPDSVWEAECRTRLFALKRTHEKLIKVYENQFPKYYQLKYNNNPISLDETQKSLKSGTTLLEYLVADSIIYAFAINKNGVTIKDFKVPNLKEKLKTIQSGIKENNYNEYADAAYGLYSKIIKPIDIQNKNIIIIPDGPLWRLNFDILLTQKNSSQDFKLSEYLIKDYAIHYANSATLLFQNSEASSSPSSNECLAFSFSNDVQSNKGNFIAMRGTNTENLSKIDLPGTRKEITSISEVMGGKYFYGSFANEKNFKKNAKDYQVLHLALHGEIDNTNPMNSMLFFNNAPDSLEDNFLHAYELYNLELNAEMAVLSACNTGTGKLVKGEGIMSLGRAFKYAGCKSLLLSQWELSDEFTPEIMKNFYKNLKSGMTKSEALRQAKLFHLENSFNLSANPYLWASLVQVGDNSPLPKKSIWVWVALGIVIVTVAISTYSIIKKK